MKLKIKFFIILILIIIIILLIKNNKENFNESNLKIFIVTPSIGRENLIRTCNSIHKQKYKNWNHIILFDDISDSKIKSILRKIPYKPIIKKGVWKNYGNGQRYEAWNMVDDNSIITYIDDDDYYKNNSAFDIIVNKFNSNKNLEVIFWAGIRYGKYFNNKPPAKKKTMSNQFAHYKYDKNNKPIRWLNHKKFNKHYSIDGLFINKLVKNYKYDYINIPLVVVEKSNFGK